MKKLAAALISAALFLSSCSKVDEKPIVLSVDIWVGASPIYYAAAKGWLEEPNIKVIVAPSITDNMKNYTSGAADMLTSTNREYRLLKKTIPDYYPIIIYDRSAGGDIILANRTVDELKSAPKVEVYMERDTVGEEMWSYFARFEMLDTSKFTLLSRFQEELSMMKSDTTTPPRVVVTYNPHNLPLLKNGYKEIATSKDERYLIVDGVHTKKAFALEHKERLLLFKQALEKAVEAYKKDPKEFYETVKPTLGNPSFEEFQTMVANIEWVLPYPKESIMQQLQQSGYETKELI